MAKKTVQQGTSQKMESSVTMRMRVGKEILGIILATTLLSVIWSCSTSQAPTVYYGGTIITMEDAQPTAQAVVAGVDGRIAFVGDRETAFERYPSAQRIDLGDKTLMPGFLAQHLHVYLGALTMSIAVIAPEAWELPHKTWQAVETRAEYENVLKSEFGKWEKACAESDTPSVENFFDCDTFWTWGYNKYWYDYLTRDFLDGISGTGPTSHAIGVWGRSAHEFWVNSKFVEDFTLTQKGIDDAPGAGTSKQCDLDKGHFWEAGYFNYLLPIIFPELGSDDRFRFGITQLKEILHRNGVTAFCEPGAAIDLGVKNLKDLYKELLGAEDTPFYSFFISYSGDTYDAIPPCSGDPMPGNENWNACRQEMLKKTWEEAQTFGTTGKIRYFQKQIKLMFDGAIVSLMMVVDPGYYDDVPPGTHVGEYDQEEPEVKTITKIFWDEGYQILVHVNGNKALGQLLEILKKRQEEHSRKDHRFTIVHFATSTEDPEDQIDEISALGAIISANPYYVTGFGTKFGETGGLGPDRAHAMVRLAPAEKLGIPISVHSDMPIAPEDPLFLAWSAATRHTNEWTEKSPPGEDTLRPDLALSRDAALRAITIEAAYSWRMEDSLGSIKPNKIANFTILEENPYEVDLDRLKDIEVYGTVFEGRLFPVPEH